MNKRNACKEWLKRFPVRPGPGFWIYLAALTISVVGTQALRSPVSALVFYLMIALFPAGVIYLTVGVLSIQTYVDMDKNRVEKNEPLPYRMELVNHSFLPFPVVEAYLSVPRPDGIRCMDQKLVLCLMPSGAFHHEEVSRFRFRGTYTVGVDRVVLTDLFRMFSYTKRVELFHTVLVFPRKMSLAGEPRAAESDESTHNARTNDSSSASQLGNVREYRDGDLLRHIHWKLSAKSEDWLVKEYLSDIDQTAYVLADFSGRREQNESGYPAARPSEEKKPPVRSEKEDAEKKETEQEPKVKKKEKKKTKRKKIPTLARLSSERVSGLSRRKIRKKKRMEKRREKELPEVAPLGDTPGRLFRAEWLEEVNERMADGVSEIALSRLMEKLEEGCRCRLIWFDERAGTPIQNVPISDVGDLETVWAQFSTTPICSHEHSVADLMKEIDEKSNVTVHLISGWTDEENLRRIEALPRQLGGNAGHAYIEWLLYHPEELFENPAEQNRKVWTARQRLAPGGVAVKMVRARADAEGNTKYQTIE